MCIYLTEFADCVCWQCKDAGRRKFVEAERKKKELDKAVSFLTNLDKKHRLSPQELVSLRMEDGKCTGAVFPLHSKYVQEYQAGYSQGCIDAYRTAHDAGYEKARQEIGTLLRNTLQQKGIPL